MERIIIGSRAIRKWFPDYEGTDDLTFAVRSPDGKDYENTFYNAVWIPGIWCCGREYRKSIYAHPDILYTIAKAGIPGGEGLEFLESKGAKVVEPVYELLNKRNDN